MANPFEDDMDDPPVRSSSSAFKSVTKKTKPSMQDEWNFYEQQIETTMQNTLDSTKRSMALLQESEAVGIKTAENLADQGEKLQKAEQRLDEIDQTTTETQRNLNNIKSVFGGIKNYFSKKPSSAGSKGGASDTKLNNTVSQLKTSQSDTFQSSSSYRSNGKASKGGGANAMPPPSGGSLAADSRKAIEGTRWAAMDDEIDENLDMMSENLRRLQHLGQALGDEVDEQNKVLDRLDPKTQKMDAKIRDQDAQMQKILGVKPKKADGSAAEGGGSSNGPGLLDQASSSVNSMGTSTAMKAAKWSTGAGKFW